MSAILNSNQYRYTGRGPLDDKALVKTFAELISESTWKITSGNKTVMTAYNGMVTAVWLNKEDLTKNGIYFLFDPNVTGVLKAPDVTNEANWHKLAELSELSNITGKISTIEAELSSTISRLDTVEIAKESHDIRLDKAESDIVAIENNTKANKADLEAIYKVDNAGITSGLLVEEIARAKAVETKIDDTLAVIIGTDNGKSIREIAADETAKIIAGADADYDTLKEIADFIKSDIAGATTMATDIAELKEKIDIGDKSVKTYVDDAIATKIAATQLKASEEVTIDEEGTLGIGEISTDKLVQGNDTLVLSGGDSDDTK
jgi:hypothetical protein